MKKTNFFLIVFVVVMIISFFIGNSLVEKSFLHAVGRDLTYNQSIELWDENSRGIKTLIFCGSVIFGLIIGGVSTFIYSKSKKI